MNWDVTNAFCKRNIQGFRQKMIPLQKIEEVSNGKWKKYQEIKDYPELICHYFLYNI
jgi:hypothetical protein